MINQSMRCLRNFDRVTDDVDTARFFFFCCTSPLGTKGAFVHLARRDDSIRAIGYFRPRRDARACLWSWTILLGSTVVTC